VNLLPIVYIVRRLCLLRRMRIHSWLVPRERLAWRMAVLRKIGFDRSDRLFALMLRVRKGDA